MRCPHCFKENVNGGTFCAFCGKSMTLPKEYDGPVNMWGEPIAPITREFEPVEEIAPQEDLEATRVVPTEFTDLSSGEPVQPAPAPRASKPTSRQRDNRKLIIGVVVAAGALMILALLFIVLRLIMPGEENGVTPANQFEIQVEDDHVCIRSYIGNDATVVLPSRIDGTPVTKILKKAFANRNLISVTVPETVTSIDDTAFEGNPDLVLYGRRNTAVELYAKRHELPFALIGTTYSATTTMTTGGTGASTSATVSATGTTATTATTTAASTTVTTSRKATYAATTTTTPPPPATDPYASAMSLVGNTFAEVKTRLGSDYKMREGGLSFPYHSQIEFGNYVGQEPGDDAIVVGVVITQGDITDRARIGDTLRQLQALITADDEWTVQPQQGVGQSAFCTTTVNGETLEVILYFSGEGEDAHCIQAYVGYPQSYMGGGTQPLEG